ncbi:septation ring formation regulator EzrA [Dellaglioa sp. P0083]|uniref:septation ring formation regulator EzrA n=1 Tax=Dellaglioa kimchii TaxID=3344667 RepID=UPI0038D45BAB
MTQIFVGIIVVAIIIYATAFFLQKRNEKKFETFRDQVKVIAHSEVEQQLQLTKDLGLTGESLKTFSALQSDFKEVQNAKLPKISTQINEAYEANSKYQFLSNRQLAAEIEVKLISSEKTLKGIEKALTSLKESDESNHQAVDSLEKKYQDLRKTLLSKNFSYGPSIDKLEDKLTGLEDDFDRFSTLTSAGDHDTAEKVLSKLREDTTSLEKILDEIPPLYKSLKNEFPDQLAELQSGYMKLTDENYNFPVGDDIPKQIDEIQTRVDETLLKLENLEVASTIVAVNDMANQIDYLYDVMEKELAAKDKIEKQEESYRKFIDHAEKQSQMLLVELDRLGQNYELSHNELEDAQKLNQQIRDIDAQHDTDKAIIDSGEAIYSEMAERVEQNSKLLEKIESEQQKIDASIQDLRSNEKKASATIQRFDIELHQIKRQVEQVNLPGLPNDYLDFFYVVSDEIEEVEVAIGKLRINIEKIAKQIIDIEADLESLEDKTHDLIDSASLSESLLQYANRFRNSNEEIAIAFEKAKQLFNNDFNYAASLETIATALDKVEPGSYKKIEKQYYDNMEDSFEIE